MQGNVEKGRREEKKKGHTASEVPRSGGTRETICKIEPGRWVSKWARTRRRPFGKQRSLFL